MGRHYDQSYLTLACLICLLLESMASGQSRSETGRTIRSVPRVQQNQGVKKPAQQPPVATPKSTSYRKPVYKRPYYKGFGLGVNGSARYYLAPAYGAMGWYRWRNPFALEWGGRTGKFASKGASDDLAESLKGAQNSIFFVGRYYVWEVMYIGVGLNAVRYSGEYGFEDVATGKEYLARFSSQMGVADVFIGNEWFAGPVLLGVDWIGGAIPLVTEVSVNSDDRDSLQKLGAESVILETRNVNSIEDAVVKVLNRQTQIFLLNFRVGWKF